MILDPSTIAIVNRLLLRLFTQFMQFNAIMKTSVTRGTVKLMITCARFIFFIILGVGGNLYGKPA